MTRDDVQTALTDEVLMAAMRAGILAVEPDADVLYEPDVPAGMLSAIREALLAALPPDGPEEPRTVHRCTPVYGQCFLASGHEGPHHGYPLTAADFAVQNAHTGEPQPQEPS